MITFPEYLKLELGDACVQRPQLLEVAEALEAFLDNGCTEDVFNLSMPARFGKSRLATALSSYLIIKNSETRILRATYAASLAESFSMQVRTQLERFYEKFGLNIQTEGTMNRWRIRGNTQDNHAGVGLGGGITGFGFDVAIIDDTAKNMKDAVSASYARTLSFFKESVLLGRLEGNWKIINVGTRWTLNDWFSYWPDAVSYVLPAMGADGETCCEDWKTTEKLLLVKSRISAEVWNAQYMQHPTAKGKIRLFEGWDPEVVQIPGGGDDFLVIDPSTDYGVDFFTIFHYSRVSGIVYLVDAFAKQRALPSEAAEWIKRQEYKICWIEANGVGANIITKLRNLGVRSIAAFSTTGDKYSRAYAQVEDIKNYFRIGDYCNKEAVEELRREADMFPLSGENIHDDLIDNVVMSFERIKN